MTAKKKVDQIELDELAKLVADLTIAHINLCAQKAKSGFPYKTQYILEETIKILQEKI